MVMDSLKKIGSRFAFEFFLEVWKPKLIEALRNWLTPVSVEDARKMVAKGKFPDTSTLDFPTVTAYVEYIEQISLERLVEEYLAPARPDLVQALQEMGMPAAKWLAKLRLRLLDKIRQGEQPAREIIPKEDTVLARCDACNKSWPVARSQFDNIDKCPFCGAPAKGESII